VKTSFVGSFPRDCCSTLDRSITSLSHMTILSSLGRVFGGVRSPRLRRSLLGTLGKVLTIDNLRKQHVIVVNCCCLCKRCGESVNHLFLHCEIACALWSAIFSCGRLTWVMLRTVVDIFACWRELSGSPQNSKVWKIVLSYLL
jgi:hypothetical protein